MKYSREYHDYVFDKNKLIGKFEDMYKYSSDIPWHQDKTVNSVFSDIDIAMLKQFKYDSICEIGCGLGFFSNRMFEELGSSNEDLNITGIDISQTAVKKATNKFPLIRFVTGDLVKENPLPNEKFDLVVIKEVIWYVYHHINDFLTNSLSLAEKNGWLFVSQSFPETERWVGQDVIDSPERLKEILMEYADPIHSCIEWNRTFNGQSFIHFFGRLKH